MVDADRADNDGFEGGGLDNERVVLVLRIAREGSVVGSWGEMAPHWRDAAREAAAITATDGTAGVRGRVPLRATLARTLIRAHPSFADTPLDDILPPRPHDGRADEPFPEGEERVTAADGTPLIITTHALAAGGGLLTVTERLAPEHLDGATIRNILDLLPATVSIKDARRRYVFVNRAWEAYANLPRRAVLGRTHEQVVSPDIDPRSRGRHTRDVADRDGHVLATGQALLAQEEHYVLATGAERTLLSNKLPLFADTGAVNGVLSITMDVSDMVEAQALLERARREAEDASRGKTEFLATISHELRTPLNGIVGLVGLLELTDPSPGQRALISKLGDSTGILSAIIESILEFAQNETRPTPPKRERVTVEELITGAVAPLTDEARAKGLTMVVDIDASARATVAVDRGGVHRVVSELVGNAITFTEKGSITIHVTIDRRNERESVLQVDVIDTGIGIRTDEMSKLFTPLFQADQSSTRRHGGIGMGLAVCRRAVEAMGGTLRMVPPEQRESSHQGSTFRMRIGVGLDETREGKVDGGRDELADLTILCGRDQAAITALAARLAPAAGPAPEIGGDPADTLALVARHAAKGRRTRALVIHGGGMAAGDGPLYERISILFGLPRIPIIAIGIDPPDLPDALYLPEDADRDVLRSTLAAVGDKEDGDTVIGAAPAVAAPVAGTETALEGLGSVSADQPADRATRKGIPETMRVLLAEDNEVNQLVAVGMLKSLGFEVDVVVNGEEAVAAVGRSSYAAVLMDIRMPVMDGLEATRNIRAMGGDAATVPIIAVTANAMRGDQESCLAAGMNDYLAKPIRLATLQTTLRRWLPLA